MEIKRLKDLFDFVCMQNKGTIEISCSGSSGGWSWDTSYTIEGNTLSYDARYDEIESLCNNTWSKLDDYPEDTTVWEISCDEVKIQTIGQYLNQGEDENEDDFYNRNMNTHNITIKQFNEIYKIL